MSWFVVGGIAIGATAGAIAGSKEGGDDVWKGALIGGAIGGTAGVGGGYAAGAFGAEAAAPAVIAGEGGAGILGAGGAMAPAAAESLAFTGPSVGSVVAPEAAGGFGASSGMGLGQAGGFGTPGAFAGSSSPFGSFGGATAPEGGGLLNAGFAPGMQAPVQMVQTPAATEYAMWGGDTASTASNAATQTPPPAADSPLKKGFESAKSWLSEPKNAMLTGVLGLGALSMFNQNNEDNFGGSAVTPAGYPLSPNFKPSRYQPTRSYADGGITSIGRQTGMFPQSQYDKTQFATPSQMPISREVVGADYDTLVNPYTGEPPRFAEGGDVDERRERYLKSASRYQGMIDPHMKADLPETPDWVRSRGVYHDEDPDTKYQDALTAAQTRMGKAAGRANVRLGAMQKPTPLGKLNLGPVQQKETEDDGMAGGGITSLGGYAHGGNPRLLRGPGDGMSDDIPASIADKQPARLADGEFVVPADVVSGLGNGSTEAGAKKLHQMMDKVRVDRTGTKKQGKQINADKYVPGAKAEKKASGGIAGYADGGGISYGPEFVRNMSWGPYFVNDEYGNPVPLHQAFSSQEQVAPVSSTANTTAQGYNPDYYNPQVYKSQLPAAEWEVSDATKQLGALQSTKGFDPNWYLSQNPDVARNDVYGGNPYQHYLDYGIKEGRSPYEGGQAGMQIQDPAAVAEQQARLDKANAYLGDLKSNVGRLENSSIKYDPYTISNRPSAAEPQFYGNIYKPTYENYTLPEYDMNAGLGRWNNITQGPRFDEATYLQNKLTQLSGLPSSAQTRMFDEPAYLQNKLQQLKGTEFENYNPQQLKNFIASQGMTLPQHYEQWGKSEGIADPYRAYTAPELKTAIAQAGMTPAQHYEQYGRLEGIANPYIAYSQPTPTLAADIAAAQIPKAEQRPEEKKARKGGILAAKK